MKKNYFALSAMLLASCIAFAQNKISTSISQEHETKIVTSDLKPITEAGYTSSSKKAFANKAFGDTIPNTLITFDSAYVANNITIVNNNANNFQWKWWNSAAQNGQSTTGFNTINSTSASDGYMSLPSDFYNTPRPVGGSVPMDTYFETPFFDLTNGGANPGGLPAVWVNYQQFIVYCCLDASLTGTVRILMQVSTDGWLTSTDFLANDGVPSNSVNTSNAQAGTTNSINISAVAGGADSVSVRFYADGNTNYFWYIDDFALVEGAENDIVLVDEKNEFYWDGHVFNPFYGEVPFALFPPLPFSADILNNGSNPATNAHLDVDVRHTATPVGGAGTGLVYSGGSGDSLVGFDTLGFFLSENPRFVPLVLGEFEVDFVIDMDSLDQNFADNTGMLTYRVGDTSFIKDDFGYGGGTGSGSYVRGGSPGGTAVGDRYGTKYIFEPNFSATASQRQPTSVTFGVSDDVVNIGVEIVPKMWVFHEDSLFSATVTSINQVIGAEVASSFIPYTVAAADTNTLLTIPFDNGTAFTNGLDSAEQYIVGFEVTSIAGGTNFEVYDDFTSSLLQPAWNTFLYFGHSPGWGTTGDNPVIRLNMGNLPIPTGVKSTSITDASFEISPNPNNGIFNLKVTSQSQATYNLNVRNMLGQTVYTDIINVNGSLTERLDLTNFEKGVYFVSLENENGRLLKKVVVK